MSSENDAGKGTEIPVLIVGGGPVGLALAADLGRRGVPCLVIEQGDGTIAYPRANVINIRTMEFCRRWGIAKEVREQGIAAGFSPHRALFDRPQRPRDRPHRAARRPREGAFGVRGPSERGLGRFRTSASGPRREIFKKGNWCGACACPLSARLRPLCPQLRTFEFAR